MSSIAESHTLFEIDAELGQLMDEIQDEIENGSKASEEQVNRFEDFCKAHGEKVDRIGRFLQMMEARARYCRSEANRLFDRARSADRKCSETEKLVLYYLESRELRKIEGTAFTLRRQKNSVSSVRILDEQQIPMEYKVVEASIHGGLWQRILEALPDNLKREFSATMRQVSPWNDAIRQATGEVPGAEVKRGLHLRVV
jgi:hypothetical protein